MANHSPSAALVAAQAAIEIRLTDSEFAAIRDLAYQRAGISMSDAKKALVESRLRKRVAELGFASFHQYVQFINSSGGAAELQTALDFLTTNETYFFREPQHFAHLRDQVLAKRKPGHKVRIWSAACSSGEEPYSIAMQLAATLGAGDWEVYASDLSTKVLVKARAGHYPMTRASGIPPEYLRNYCLRGVGNQEGTLLIEQKLRQRVHFMHLNLIESLPSLGVFDVIFLRNVMIYFDNASKRRVVGNLAPHLAPSGFLYIGHSETLNGITDEVVQVRPAIYSKAKP